MNSIVTLLLFSVFTATVRAEEWPEGYVIYEHSISPDKQFGILIPSISAKENSETPGKTNYLANLVTHHLLGRIAEARYWENANHAGLTVLWAPDGSFCVADYEARFGFHSISALLIQRDGTAFRQLNLGD